jgi:hypothetical protein
MIAVDAVIPASSTVSQWIGPLPRRCARLSGLSPSSVLHVNVSGVPNKGATPLFPSSGSSHT